MPKVSDVASELHGACTAVVLPQRIKYTDNATTMHLRHSSKDVGMLHKWGSAPAYQFNALCTGDAIDREAFLQLGTRLIAKAVDRMLKAFIQSVAIVPAS